VFRVLRDSDAQVEISTPSISAKPLRKGVYRVTVRPDGNTEITVRAGEAEVFSPGGTELIRAGQTMVARGNPSDPEFQVAGAYPEDEFDRWCGNRDRDLERSTSYRYVSPDITGAEDLDNYGRWTNDGSYGNVWVPTSIRVGRRIARGHWAWLDYYGWTWVSDDPWGWAPYHYGRWYQGFARVVLVARSGLSAALLETGAGRVLRLGLRCPRRIRIWKRGLGAAGSV